MAASVVALSSFVPAYAAFNGATLSGVEIIPQDDSYQVTLKADKNIQIQKYVTADDKVVLDLKGTKPANFVNTVYNNATKIDHVIIQPTSSDSIRIFLEGANVSGTKVSLDTSVKPVDTSVQSEVSPLPVSNQTVAMDSTSQATDTAVSEETKESETVVLNRPVDSFKPFGATYSESLSDEEDAVDSVQDGMVSFGALKKVFSTHTLDWFLRLGMLALLIMGAYKLFVEKKQKKVTIDLSAQSVNLKAKEIDIHKTLSKKRATIGGGLSDLSRKPGYVSTSRYGLKEYQNSQIPPLGLNPAMSRQKFENRIPQTPLRQQTSKTLLRKEMPQTLQASSITRNDMNKAKLNMDGVKFLESMAQIYERSGRVDLAKGLHTSIVKAKASNRAVF